MFDSEYTIGWCLLGWLILYLYSSRDRRFLNNGWIQSVTCFELDSLDIQRYIWSLADLIRLDLNWWFPFVFCSINIPVLIVLFDCFWCCLCVVYVCFLCVLCAAAVAPIYTIFLLVLILVFLFTGFYRCHGFECFPQLIYELFLINLWLPWLYYIYIYTVRDKLVRTLIKMWIILK